MTYSAMVRQVLVSCPGDIADDDLWAVQKAITRWNVLLGRQFGTNIIPVSWNDHAAASLGVSAQDVINEQLVDSSDFIIALFWTRLGTSTANAESGTAEEIDRLRNMGKLVSVLQCVRPLSPDKYDSDQKRSLDDYLKKLYQSALILKYASSSELASHVDTILTRQATKLQAADENAILEASNPTKADVWPHVDVRSYQETDARGRLREKRRWSLRLTNNGNEVAKNVTFMVQVPEGEQGPDFMGGEEGNQIEALAPHGGEASFTFIPTWGTAAQALCVIEWDDSSGHRRNEGTIRFS